MANNSLLDKQPSLSLTDITGKVLQMHKQVRQATTRIVTDGLADGAYVLVISWGNDHRTVKLVKQTGANR
ncbi:MAG: T9SS type A sorting domain-containing protein [Edaphocola sp.]